jgi:hypothetical protein
MVDVLAKHGISTDVPAIDVGGSKRVILDNRESPNPLFKLSPRLTVLDKGFQSELGIDRKVDFLDIDSIRLLSQKFQLVYCFDTLEHVDNPFLWCRHLRFITSTGGHIYLSTVFSFPYHPSPEDYWRFSPAALELLFDHAAIKVIESGWEKAKDGTQSVYILGRVG